MAIKGEEKAALLPREDVLQKTIAIITADRQDLYGKPEDSFSLIAAYWTVYLEGEGERKALSPVDVATMMELFKIARSQTGAFHKDNFIDRAGYAALAYEAAYRADGGGQDIDQMFNDE